MTTTPQKHTERDSSFDPFASLYFIFSSKVSKRLNRNKKCNTVYAVQCSEECSELYDGETKQALHKRMSRKRRGNNSGPESAVYLHLKETGHCFEDLMCTFWIEKIGGLRGE